MVEELAFQRLDSEACAYVKNSDQGLMLIGVHVDNMITAADKTDLMDELEASLL